MYSENEISYNWKTQISLSKNNSKINKNTFWKKKTENKM